MATLLILLAAGAVAQAPQQAPVFRGDVSQAKVDVQVSVRGRLVAGLKQGDFIVRDEGVPQKIVYFGRESEPLSLLLLLDVSGSMKRFVGQVADAAERALRYLSPEDRAAVMLFSRRAEAHQEFSTDRREVAVRIRDATEPHQLGAGTAINESILTAGEYMRTSAAPGRRAILILTDNSCLNYKTPDDTVVNALFNLDTVLNAMVAGHVARPEKERPNVYRNPDFTPSDVFAIADQTGGEAIRAERVDKLFPEMLERIRTRYSLGYNAPASDPGSFHRISVELATEAAERYPGAAVRARHGYFAAR